MKKQEIEKKLNQTISSIVPDVLENILTRCEEREGLRNMNFIKEKEDTKELVETKKEKKKFFTPKLVGAFATCFICLFGILGFSFYQTSVNSVDSIIDFDVNPSIEIKTNRNEEIIDAIALNDEGKLILEDMDLEKVDLDVGVNAIIGSMLKNGYITEAQNSILVSVKNGDEAKAKALEEKISKEIDSLLNAQNIEGSVLSQMYSDDDAIEKLAQENNISEGKANLINKALDAQMKDSKGNLYTFDSLSQLSINELNLLLDSKNVVLNTVSSTGNANGAAYIGNEKAKEIALAKAGVTAQNASNLKVELDCDNGVLIYEVEFNSGTNEYEYEINAENGDIIQSSVEIDDDRNNNKVTTTTNTTINNNSNTSTNSNSNRNSSNSTNNIPNTNNSYQYYDRDDDDRDDDRYDDDRDDDRDDRDDDDDNDRDDDRDD